MDAGNRALPANYRISEAPLLLEYETVVKSFQYKKHRLEAESK